MKNLVHHDYDAIKFITYDCEEDNSEKEEEVVVVAVACDFHFGGRGATACKGAVAAGKLAELSRFGTRRKVEGFFGLAALG